MDILLMVCVHAYGDLRLMSGPLYPPPVLILFSVPVIKYPRESKVEKVFILFSLFWRVVPSFSPPLQTNRDGRDLRRLVTSAVKSSANGCTYACAQLISPFYSVLSPAFETMLPTFRVSFLTLINPLKKMFYAHTHRPTQFRQFLAVTRVQILPKWLLKLTVMGLERCLSS